ncbi:hypothetical protein QVD17_22983 [Tagetes erecta]|uniref:Phytocyanin domain-containing protein n=1 Tax=Tagetes erecta TaxID=13708 RepID=A0AAD8KDW9_TARER|nr:hypothetical protein QVD17_22983 [Tagetes erecta]
MENIKMMNLLLVITMVVTSMEFHGTMAIDLSVGDSFGWNVPSNEIFYDVWAMIQEGGIYVNDVLVFNFATGVHNVAEVSLQAHDACDGSNPIKMYTSGPAHVSLNTAGIHYFISTIGSDCKSYMRMIVRVEKPPANNSSSTLLN